MVARWLDGFFWQAALCGLPAARTRALACPGNRHRHRGSLRRAAAAAASIFPGRLQTATAAAADLPAPAPGKMPRQTRRDWPSDQSGKAPAPAAPLLPGARAQWERARAGAAAPPALPPAPPAPT